MRKAAWILAVILLLVTGCVGLMNAAREWDDASSALQRTVWFGVLLYGFLGVAGGIGLALRRRWSVGVAAAWALAVTWAGTVASFAFHDPTFSQSGTLAGTVAALISLALIGWFVVWAARSATRAPSLPRAVATDHIPSP
jgi:hypothetical protein